MKKQKKQSVPTDQKDVKVDGELVRLKRGPDGKWRTTGLTRKWKRANSTYHLTIQLETLFPASGVLFYDVSQKIKSIFSEILENNGGKLVDFFTNNTDAVIINIIIPRTKSPADIVSVLKSNSSRKIKEVKEISKRILKLCEERSGNVYGKMFWGGGYEIISGDFPKTTPDEFVEVADEDQGQFLF